MVVAAIWPRPDMSAQAAGLNGAWTIDRPRSEFPSEIGFGASFMPASPGAPDASGGRGRGRAGRTNPVYSRPDSQDDARRIQQLTDAVRTPPINLSIVDAGPEVTITADGRATTFHPTGKEESVALGQTPVTTVTTRVPDGIVVLFHAAEGRDVRYTYWRAANSSQLMVDVVFVQRGAPESSIGRVYAPGTAAPASTPDGTAASGPAAGTAGSPGGTGLPPVATGPDAALKGLTKLGIVVEPLNGQAAACGLAHDAIEAAVTKAVSDAGLTVVREVTREDNTYVYVNVMTTSTAAGLCVSRFDVSLLSEATAKLPYQTTSALVEVQLAHSGSLSGGDAKTHAEAVMHGVTQYTDDIVARIRGAAR